MIQIKAASPALWLSEAVRIAARPPTAYPRKKVGIESGRSGEEEVTAMQPAPKLEAPAPAEPEGEELSVLRRLACRARLSRREEPERMCALLQAQPAAEAEAYGEALLRMLPVALGRRVTFHRPGAGSCSFDEAWVLALLRSIRADDGDSVRFALASRISRHMQRQVRFLAEGFACRIDRLTHQAI